MTVRTAPVRAVIAQLRYGRPHRATAEDRATWWASVHNQEMGANEELHRLIDMLPEADWPIASRFLHFLAEGGGDEPLSDEDWAAVREGEAEIARGEFVTLAELKRELDS